MSVLSLGYGADRIDRLIFNVDFKFGLRGLGTLIPKLKALKP